MKVASRCSCTDPKMVENSTEPKVQKVSASSSMKKRSPTRFTMKAFIAALQALSFSYQKPISR